MKAPSLIIVAWCLLTASCVTRQYYLSPFHATDHPYKAMPMVADSTPSAFYAGGNLTLGGANQNLRDGLINLQGTIHRAHTFQRFQFLYGGSLSAGGYHISENNFTFNNNGNPGAPFKLGGSRFFGGAGVFGGANLVIPFRTGSEWRVIGMETSFQHEFGDYAGVRSAIPDSAVDLVWRKNYFHTIGVTTDVIKKFRKSGNSFGYKFGVYFSTASAPYTGQYAPGRRILPAYISHT
ncbi:MAG: hypothetical protein EOP49_36100, partial [Sphingobacteriales bacterium]